MTTTNTTRYTLNTVHAGDTIHYVDVRPHPSATYDEEQAITLIDHATYSDYSGSAVERSNYRVLLADPEIAPHLVQVIGSHGTQAVAYLGTAEGPPEFIRETLERLESYSILDESDESEMELELELDAWSSYGAQDFATTLTRMFDRLWDDKEHDVSSSDVALAQIWRQGCDSLNVNGGVGFQIEGGGSVYFYIDEWISKFERHYSDFTRPSITDHWDDLVALVEGLSDRSEIVDDVSETVSE